MNIESRMTAGGPLTPRRPTFAVFHTWPGIKNAEYEIIQRIIRAAENIGVGICVVDNDGYLVDSDEGSEHRTLRRVDRDDCDFVLSLHFESPRLLDLYSYAALWNPIDFYSAFGYHRSIEKLASHNDVLSCQSDIADAHAASLFGNLGRGFQLPAPVFFHTVPGPCLEPNVTEQSKMFYIGINWERISGKKGRHHDLLESLDKDELIRIYGPELFMGIRPWKGFKCYSGSIPFDGRSVIEKINEAGICLVLSSTSHQQSGIMSSRLFEALAAGAAIICNPHPLIDKYFADCVYIVDDDVSPLELSTRIRELVLEIRKAPSAALERAKRAQARFIENGFGLEHCLSSLFEVHPQRTASFEKLHFSAAPSRVAVLLNYPGPDIEVLETMIANVRRQRGVGIDLVVMCDTSLHERYEARITAACQGDHLRSTVIHDGICTAGSNGPSRRLRATRTNPLFARALDIVDADYFCTVQPDDTWFEDHLTTLARTLQDNQDAVFACSGRITEAQGAFEKPTRHLDALTMRDFSALLESSQSRDVGRYLYRTTLLRDLPRSVRNILPVLDGQEHRLLNLWAALGSMPAQSNYATYVHQEAMNAAVHMPYFPLPTQIEMIRDTVRGRSDWLMKLANARQWERTEHELQQIPRVRFDRFPKLDKGRLYQPEEARLSGFHPPAADGSWMDGTAGVMRFEFDTPDSENWLLLIGSGRDSKSTGEKQTLSLTLNGKPLGSEIVSEREQRVHFKIDREFLADTTLMRLELKLAHAEPVLDDNGKTIDARKLGFRLHQFGLLNRPVSLKLEPDKPLDLATDGQKLICASRGFFDQEGETFWIDGLKASIDVEIKAPDVDCWLKLTAAGRASVVTGEPQSCTITLGGVVLGAVLLDEAVADYFLRIPSTVPQGLMRLEFEAAHAEPVSDDSGETLDPRALGVRIGSIGIVKPNYQLPFGRMHSVGQRRPDFKLASKGFFEVERDAVWMDGELASIRFGLRNDADELPRRLVLIAAGRPARLTGESQRCRIWLDDIELGQIELSEGYKTFTLPIPVDVGPDSVQLKLLCSHAEPVLDADGEVLDPRKLGLRLQACGIVSGGRLRSGRMHLVEDDPGFTDASIGFFPVEQGAAWIDGRSASIDFELRMETESVQRSLVIVAAGRPSSAGEPQRCTITLGDVELGRIELGEEFARFALPVPDEIEPGTVQLKLLCSHAEPVLSAEGEVLDPRNLGLRLQACGILTEPSPAAL